MADKTRAQMIDHVLKRLGVIGAGQSASAEDTDLVGSVLDTVHSQYRKRGLANFAISAFPDWAQEPFAKLVAAEAAPHFGLRGDVSIIGDGREGERQLAEQMQGRRHPIRVRTRYY